MGNSLLNELNDEQKLAVQHVNGPCLVVAGPGSGKTRVISHRLINLVLNENISPKKVLAISFTKASSTEMKNRTISLSNDHRMSRISFGTFHSVFFRILRYFEGYDLNSLIDDKTKLMTIKNIMKTLNIEDADNNDVIGDVIKEISYVKNELMNPRDFKSNVVEIDDFEKLYNMYENIKYDINKIDFDDMLIKTYELLKRDINALNMVRDKYKFILVDEFQDINKVQFEVMKLICNPDNNIFVVGDEDQSIYGFRGARPDFLIEFEKYFGKSEKIVLDSNYRSYSEILEVSNKLIEKNKNRYEKVIISKLGSGGNVKYISAKDSDDEANIIINEIVRDVENRKANYNDYAIIYRNNIQSRAFVDILIDRRINFSVKDVPVTIYDHWACRDLISYLKIGIEKSSNEDWVRIINKPFRYISRDSINKVKNDEDFLFALINKCDLHKKQVETLEDLDIDMNYIKGLSPEYAISYIRETLDYDRYILDYCTNKKIKVKDIMNILIDFSDSAKNYKTTEEFLNHIEEVKLEISKKDKYDSNGIMLTTMHSAKGLEFKYVYIVGVDEKTIPYSDEKERDPVELEKHIEEERRLLYVGITRAKQNVCISYPTFKHNKKVQESMFIEETKI
ncbi:ATP-dependent helicase [Clostridioides mangenotii]|uniref:ATP-dependent helicase n=1 Tax=Metaclostridioides mangenotii TaxID=1540 RepID=UPI001C105B7D|nr:ATP-dependent helicase [Clostridioides mangenotii]MBU5307309.1 ATP-dependent helicase [Clostridioides mangenotii]